MKRLITMACLICLVSVANAEPKRALAFLIQKTKWQAIPTAKKQQGKAILQACCNSDSTIPLAWSWGLRSKADTNKVWGFAVYSGNAWALSSRRA